MKKSATCIILLLALTCVALSCKQHPVDEKNPGNGAGADSSPIKFDAVKIYDSLKNPWGMVWLPDGRLLVTERAGEILVFKNDQFTGEKLTGVPAVFNEGQGGLLDIKLHPDYKNNGWIYLSFAKPVDGGAATAVIRFKLNGNNIVDKQQLYEAMPHLPADFHFGSRIAFDKSNFLFISSGERGTLEKVWELSNDHGKVHRFNDDGTIPKDNPFVDTPGARPSIWSYGHRNPQGLVYDAEHDRLWELEHGPKGGDELNLIEKGHNYGWPKTCYGINYDGTVLTKFKEMEGVTNPVRYWVPSIAPCGMSLVTSDRYPAWKGNLMVSALSFKHIARVQLDGTKYIREEKLIQDMGRVRDVAESPEGFIYALTEGPGLLVKLVPKTN